jgi:putative ABC transport system permease protein
VKYVPLVFKNLLRNKRRAFLTASSIGVSLFLMTLLITILTAMEASTKTDGSELRLITRHKVSLTNPLPESYWKKMQRVPGVEIVCPTSWFGGVYIDDKNFFPQFAVDPKSYLELLAPQKTFRVDPEQARDWLLDRRGALVSKGLADKYGWKVGSPVFLKGRIYPADMDLRVSAIYTGEDDAVYFHRDYLEESIGRPGMVGSYYIRIDAPGHLARVAKAVDALFANSDAETLTESERAFTAGFIQMLGNVQGLVTYLSLVIAATILMVTANSMSMSVRERTTEVAVLKALGFSSRTVLALLLSEAILLAVIGGCFGVGGFWLIAHLIFDVAGFRLPMIWFTLVPPPWLVAALITSTVGLGFASGILPAWAASRRPILDGLRQA